MNEHIEKAKEKLSKIVEHRDKTIAEQAGRIKALEKLFGKENSYPLIKCLRYMVEVVNHLMNDHNCDGHGYEIIENSKQQIEKYIIEIEQALEVTDNVKRRNAKSRG
jgi:hypothetical protein